MTVMNTIIPNRTSTSWVHANTGTNKDDKTGLKRSTATPVANTCSPRKRIHCTRKINTTLSELSGTQTSPNNVNTHAIFRMHALAQAAENVTRGQCSRPQEHDELQDTGLSDFSLREDTVWVRTWDCGETQSGNIRGSVLCSSSKQKQSSVPCTIHHGLMMLRTHICILEYCLVRWRRDLWLHLWGSGFDTFKYTQNCKKGSLL